MKYFREKNNIAYDEIDNKRQIYSCFDVFAWCVDHCEPESSLFDLVLITFRLISYGIEKMDEPKSDQN